MISTTKYTAREVAKKLGLSYCYFLQKVRAGEFQHHRLSPRNIFFTDEDIESIIESCKVPAKAKEL